MQGSDLSLQNLLADYAVPVTESIVVLAAAWFLHLIAARALRRLTAMGYLTDSLSRTAVSVAKWLLVLIAVLLVLSFFGVSVTSLWVTLSGVAALVALGFVAIWSVLSNVTCSIMLVAFAPFRIGDEIEVQDPAATVIVRGRVVGMNMMFTTLQASDDAGQQTDNLLRIPNNIFFQKYTRVLPGRATTSLRKYLADQHSEGDAGA